MRLSPADIANSIRMTRSVHRDRGALLVEGLKDVRFYRNLIDDARCCITPADGRSVALATLNILRASGTRGILVLLDQDFSSVSGTPYLDSDIVVTDTHDLEGILVRSTALGRILIESDLEPTYFGSNLVEQLLSAALPIGYLRWASESRRLSLSFKNLDYTRFIGMDFRLDASKLIDAILQKNPGCKTTKADLAALIQALTHPTHDRWLICCGHDICAILAVGITRATSRPITGAMIERNLRLAYDVRLFPETKLFVGIRDREGRNAPFVVLK